MRGKGFIVILIALFALPGSGAAQSSAASLRPSKNYWDKDARHTPVRFSRLPQGRTLAAAGDTLYMLDVRNRIVWTWSADGPPLTDQPVIDSNGTIYVIGYDLLWAALDSATGKELWRGTANGRAVYTQIRLYKDDTYFVVTDMAGYRENFHGETIEDYLTLCRGNDILWKTRVPPGATVQIRGDKVFALIKGRNRTKVWEIAIPRRLGPPIGKVSMWADSK